MESKLDEIITTTRVRAQAAAGKLGGSSRSDRKRASSKANLEKARVKRWPGREKSKELVEQARRDGGDKAAQCIEAACDNLQNADRAEQNGDAEIQAEEEHLAQLNMMAAIHNANMYKQYKHLSVTNKPKMVDVITGCPGYHPDGPKLASGANRKLQAGSKLEKGWLPSENGIVLRGN